MMMRSYGRWIWLGFGFLFLVLFAIFESSALNNDGLTLSRLIYNANQAWPLTGVIFGGVVCGLAVHFFWPWHPELYKAQERIKDLEKKEQALFDENIKLKQDAIKLKQMERL